jgi:hypothetical protein
MADDSSGEGLRRRLARSSEDALGKLAQDLLENPLVNGALTRAFEAREKAAQAQEVAMGALNLPSAADIERLTRRVRSVSQRLEGIEDGVDRLDARIAAINATAGLDERLTAIERALDALSTYVKKLGTTRRSPARGAKAKPRTARPASAPAAEPAPAPAAEPAPVPAEPIEPGPPADPAAD